VSPEERLAAIVTALEEAGARCLVMGGHAVRYYGVSRNTIDFDLHIWSEPWEELPARLKGSRLGTAGPLREGPSWRPEAFRRFEIGRLPDGREEWLEFWRRNHLLAPFEELEARAEAGPYGGRSLRFLGLPDLMRSKETERESDWQDIALLEEIQDARHLALPRDPPAIRRALSSLRSRSGFERAVEEGCMADPELVVAAFTEAANPISRAFLVPYLPHSLALPACPGMIGEILTGHLRRVEPGSLRHQALVEAVRRLYKQAAREADRADKMAARGA
jgi:hypothetical protein